MGGAAPELARGSEFGNRVPVATQEKYCNLGYPLLGEVVARRRGMTYADFVRTRITEPLGMSRTVLGRLTPELEADAATPYAGRWLTDELSPVTDPLDMVSSEGGLWSCVEDLARWAGDALVGGTERKDGETKRFDGTLKDFPVSREEAEDMIINARLKAGWITEADLAVADAIPEEEGAPA